MSHKKVWYVKPKIALKFYEKSAGILKHGNGFFCCVLKVINWQMFHTYKRMYGSFQKKTGYDEKKYNHINYTNSLNFS